MVYVTHGYSLSLKEAKAGTQSRNCGRMTRREQAQLLRHHIVHSEMGLPTSITNLKNTVQTWPQTILIEVAPQM